MLLITGPNTGGKTVALKTIGLLALMAQLGLPVPVDTNSRLPVFEEVLADIGDEQSIEQSLSTFSGHMRNIIDLLERAGPAPSCFSTSWLRAQTLRKALRLPGPSLLELKKRGALTIATTHHGELKLFAHSEEGVVNAAVEFDPVSLAPTYRITVGVPGRSNALAIASRLGMPETILRAAQESLPQSRLRSTPSLTTCAKSRPPPPKRRAEEQARRRAEDARTQIEKRLEGLDEERARRLDEAALALETEVEEAREALQKARRLSEKAVAALPSQEIEVAQEAIASAGDRAAFDAAHGAAVAASAPSKSSPASRSGCKESPWQRKRSLHPISAASWT